MGNAGSVPASTVNEVTASTNFSDKDVQRLRRRFQRFVGPENRDATLEQFCSLPEIAGNPFAKRMFQQMDTDKNGVVSFQEFCAGVNKFKSLKTPAQQLLFLMQMHDLNEDGSLSATELGNLFFPISQQAFTTPQLLKIVEETIKVYDLDRDQKLAMSELEALTKDSGVSINFMGK